MNWLKLLVTMFVIIQSTKAQLPKIEELKSDRECTADISLDCGTDSVIAIHSLQYAFNETCDKTCCPYTSTDCFVHAETSDFKELRRQCSGSKSCTASIGTDIIDFTTCSKGPQDISYKFIQYYCIPETRIQSICSNGQLTSSTNQPLYLTNEGYPGVTTGVMSCSCSVEVFSCNSTINLYINDADLYSDTNNCEQSIAFKDTDNQMLSAINCEDHYGNQIEKSVLENHFINIEFTSSSIQNLEGYFFIGFDSSEQDVTFQLRCSSQPETWCTGCGTVPTIDNGNVTLDKENDDTLGASASVACNSGYKTDTPTITCQGNGTWPIPECTEKPACSDDQWRCNNGDCISNDLKCDNFPDCADESDEQSCSAPNCPEGLMTCTHFNGSSVCVDDGTNCDCGSAPTIENGHVSINGNSKIGSVADVTCNAGYNPSKPTITCQMDGSWETVTCSIKDCGSLPPLDFGHYELANAASTLFGASAKVICNTGYTSKTSTISCQSSGRWGMAKCSKEGHGKPAGPENDDSGINVIIIAVIAIVLFVFLVQLIFMSFLQIKIHNIRKTAGGDPEVLKRILMTLLGSIPVIGLVPIVMTCKVFYRDVYKVQHKENANVVKKQGTAFSNSAYGTSETVTNSSASYKHECDGFTIQSQDTHLEHVKITCDTTEETSNRETKSDELPQGHTNCDVNEIMSESESAQTLKTTTTTTAINSNKPQVHDGKQLNHHQGDTMSRGISAVFSDNKDDMTLGPTTHRSLKYKQSVEYHHDDNKHHHFSKAVEKERAELKPIMEDARKHGHHAELFQDKLYIDNSLFNSREATLQTNAHHKRTHETGDYKRTHDNVKFST